MLHFSETYQSTNYRKWYSNSSGENLFELVGDLVTFPKAHTTLKSPKNKAHEGVGIVKLACQQFGS